MGLVLLVRIKSRINSILSDNESLSTINMTTRKNNQLISNQLILFTIGLLFLRRCFGLISRTAVGELVARLNYPST